MNTSRRSFLRQSGGLLGMGLWSTFPGNLPGKAGKIMDGNVTVGAHPWIYAAKLPNYDITPVLEKIFQDVKYAHYGGVELMHHPLMQSQNVNVLKDLSDKYDLPVIGTSYGADMWDRQRHDAILRETEKILSNLSATGGRTMGISVGNAGMKKTEDQLDAQADLLAKIREMASAQGIVINLHNHTYEVENGMHDLKGTLKRLPDIPLGPDINWLQRADVDPVEFIETFGNQIVFLHLRDQFNNGRWTEALGEGDTDFAAIAHALRKISFSGDLIVELAHENDFEPTRPIRESLHMSREFVKNEMGY
jgi:sugar phosphate isomerase/epimerase